MELCSALRAVGWNKIIIIVKIRELMRASPEWRARGG